MRTIREKQEDLRAAREQRQKDHDRLRQIFAAVFSTEDGREVLEHLRLRFDLTGRSFIPAENGHLCPYRAAVRDGERAAVNYILTMIRMAEAEPPGGK